MTRRIIILGSTGSIGTQTLEVVEHLNALHARGEFPLRHEIVGLAAGRNAALLFDQAARFGVRHLALAGSASGPAPSSPGLRTGPTAAEALVREVDCDLVVAAMVGSAGLPATLAAVALGRHVALANKETLVAAGALVVPAALASGASLLPVDSEHAALWQCLQSVDHSLDPAHGHEAPRRRPPMHAHPSVRRVVLTASGGPFRTWTKDRIDAATPADALKHPTWRMGRKVTVDSASLTNKALEIIEAHWLFGLPADRIEALIHPQSIVHALVEFDDGSLLAQLGAPDMRGPIQHALTFPSRPAACAQRLDLATLSRLEFETPDPARFPALPLAYHAIRVGGTAGAIFNAANEAAVEAFLASADSPAPMRFGRIAELVQDAIAAIAVVPLRSLADALAADAATRAHVQDALGRAPVP